MEDTEVTEVLLVIPNRAFRGEESLSPCNALEFERMQTIVNVVLKLIACHGDSSPTAGVGMTERKDLILFRRP